MERAVVIVAGGKGTRMRSEIPKQFLLLRQKPLLLHTLEAFFACDPSIPIWLVLAESEHDYWREICSKYHCKIPHTLVGGGDCRPQSVKNGILAVPFPDGIVAVHDGVRPLVTAKMILESFTVAEQNGSAVASIPLKDSIRKVTPAGSIAQDRSSFRLVQTPQTFRISWLTAAYEQLDSIDNFSDEASMVEAMGRRVTLYDGDNRNIKVTSPEDMPIAEAFIAQKAP